MTSSVTDTEYEALVSATGGERLSMNDMLREYYSGLLGLPVDNDFSLSELTYQFYISLGYSGSLGDMQAKYRIDNPGGGGLPTSGRKNLGTNPRAVETGSAGWPTTRGFGTGGAGSYSWITAQAGPVGNITTARRKTWTTAATNNLSSGFLCEPGPDTTYRFPVQAGSTITVSGYLRQSAPVTAKSYRVIVLFYDAVTGGSAGPTSSGTILNVSAGDTTWQRISHIVAVPADMHACKVYLDCVTGGGLWAIGDTLDATGLLLEKSDSLKDYFDGDLVDLPTLEYTWDGTANASTSSAKTKTAPAQPDLIAELFAKQIFTVGHRGSGDVWPEHTADSYQGAFDAGIDGLEFSIQRNDTGGSGIWFHLHDIGATGLDRTTAITGDPKALVDSTINAGIKVDIGPGAFYLNPANFPNVPKFLDEMAKYFGKTVLFLETKDYSVASTNALLNLLDAQFPGYQKSVIFKTHWGNIARAADARARGMKTWIYLDDPLSIPALDSIMPVADYIGVPVSPLVAGGMTDAELQTVVARGKPVISWSVPHRFVRDRLKVGGSGGVGLQGFVSSMAPYTASNIPLRTRDNFASGKWSAGDLPYDSTRSFSLDIANACAHFGGMASNPSVTLGSMCPVAATTTIEYECRFLTLPTDLTTHLGFFFGKLDDQRYQFQVANVTQGYHAIMRANGNMQMYRHDIGVTTGVSLAGPLLTAVAVAGTWMKFRLIITPTTLSYQRIDAGGGTALTSSDTTLRGRYFGISRNYALSGQDAAGTVEFKNIIVT